MASGGSRSGSIGTLYPNRADMTQPAQAPTGQTYGQAAAQLQAQSVVPVAGSPSPPASPGTTPSTNGVDPNIMPAGSVPALTDPTADPNQPVTAGLPNSPGAGPEALSTPNLAFAPMELSMARAMFRKAPNNDMLQLIEFMTNRL